MSCTACRHFLGGEGDDFYSGKGLCTLNPVWLKIEKPNHFCGQFASDQASAESRRKNKAIRNWADFEEKQRARAIDAERKLKDARRKIRDMKA